MRTRISTVQVILGKCIDASLVRLKEAQLLWYRHGELEPRNSFSTEEGNPGYQGDSKTLGGMSEPAPNLKSRSGCASAP